jgi:TonB family protein
MGMQIIGITNNLNFALNTNRFKMMTKKKTSRLLGTKFALALPAIALLLFAFAEPEFKTKPLEQINPVTDVQKVAKEFVIKGNVVREDNGKPLPGASVIIKGTTIGTVTDANGKFTVTDPNPQEYKDLGGLGSVLVVSYVGFTTFEMKVAASGKALENGSFTCKLEEGVIVIDLPDYKNVPPPPPPPPAISDDGEELFIIVEDLPKYPGGIYDLAKYVAENQEKISKQKTIKGKARIGFTISESGKVTDIKIIEAENETAGKAAASIVEKMPDWTPGKQRGKTVPVKYLMPVEFK